MPDPVPSSSIGGGIMKVEREGQTRQLKNVHDRTQKMELCEMRDSGKEPREVGMFIKNYNFNILI